MCFIFVVRIEFLDFSFKQSKTKLYRTCFYVGDDNRVNLTYIIFSPSHVCIVFGFYLKNKSYLIKMIDLTPHIVCAPLIGSNDCFFSFFLRFLDSPLLRTDSNLFKRLSEILDDA